MGASLIPLRDLEGSAICQLVERWVGERCWGSRDGGKEGEEGNSSRTRLCRKRKKGKRESRRGKGQLTCKDHRRRL